MNTRKIVEDFLQSDFAVNHLFFHLQAGFPCPFVYKNTLGILLRFHPLQCSREKILLSAPAFEVCLLYPSGRVIRFSETDQTANAPDGIVIPRNKAVDYKRACERVYSACDEVLDFFESQRKVTPILLKKFDQSLKKNASEFGMDAWYGGLYDHDSGI